MHRLTRLVAGLAASGLLLAGLSISSGTLAGAAGGPNLAAGSTATASSTNAPYVASNLTDGNQGTYWESSGSLPQWAQVDLGSAQSVDQIVLKLPAGWGSRNETLSVTGGTGSGTDATIVSSASQAFVQGANNVVTLNFAATQLRYVRVTISANTGWTSAQLSELEVYAAGAAQSSGNLAAGKSFTASSVGDVYGPGNAGDGNQGTYWESASNAFPQWVQVDLGAAVAVNKVTLKIPTGWGARTETLKVAGSTDGTTYNDLVPSAGQSFSGANAVTLSFNQATTRYVRVTVTANTAWPAAQLAELEVYGPAGPGVDTSAPTAPSNLAYTQPASGQIKLTWNASSDNVGVTGYDVYANGTLKTTLNALTYTDSQPDSATVSYYVKAHDAAGNQSAASSTVTRTGSTPPPADTQAPSTPAALAYTQPASGQVQLTWNASSDNVGVTGYDVYANGAVRGSVNGSTLTYTDSQPDTATVSYYVRAKDAAGNQSGNSNTVTRTGATTPPPGGSNLAVGKPITASSSVFTFVATNANDNDTATYWEGSGNPSSLTVALGANAGINQVVVKLNPAAAWGPRTQTIEVLGRDQGATGFSTIKAPAAYSFDPATGNTVTIPVSATVADVRLTITANTGSGAGQVAELQVIGTPAPNPDLVVTSTSISPANPIETDAITVSTTVKNQGTAPAAATNVTVYLGTTKVGTTPVGALAAGASSTVTTAIGAQNAGTYALSAKVDEANAVIEQDDTNNTSATTSVSVGQVQSSDLVAASSSWSPSNPAAGNTVSFSVALKNQGTTASAGGAHGITVTVTDATSGATIKTLTGSYTGAIAAGATTAPVSLGSWTAANGKYTVTTVVAVDANELAVKQANNTSTQSFFVGRGANMPYDMYEAEDGVLGGGAQVVGPNRTIGDIAGEASGRRAVTLNSTGASVEFTTKASTNTLVARTSIPDGTSSSLDIYVNGTFLKAINLTSKYAWLYGSETQPGNDAGSGAPRHIYDESNVLLGTTVPAGARIKLQNSTGTKIALDFVNTEQVAPITNPDPAKYVVPAGFGQQDVQAAIDAARQSATAVGVYLPPGDYQTANKFQVYGKAVKIVGAGPWYTRFYAPSTQDNTDVGFRADATANGSTFSGFAYFGNYTSRIDGPGKVFDFANVSNMTIDNIWTEHMICMYWGANTDYVTIKNSRIRDTFADGINMTNGSTNNLVSNNDARATGDDSFALFSAIDAGGADEKDNVFENLSATLTWRAAGIAVYGGYGNTFRNIYIADTLTYSGITISSLDFGYPMNGFGANPPTLFQNISVVRAGGHFYNTQVFPAIWVFSASKVFQGIRVTDVDIVDPTYSGIMFQTNYSGGQPQNPITDTIFTNVSISGAQRSGDAYDAKSGYAVWANPQPEQGQGPPVGSVVFNNLKLSNNYQDIVNPTTTFTIVRNP